MRIDAHQHFWKYDSVRDSWMDDAMEVIKRDFLPEDLMPILNHNGIDGCIAVQADESEEETKFLLDLANRNDFIKGVVGWVNFFADDIDEKLNYFSKDNKLKGIRHILQGKPNGFMLQDKFIESLGKLEQYNLTYDILVYENQLDEAVKLVERFPNQRFVLDHIGKPKVSSGLSKDWELHLIKLSEHKNVYCKASGMVTETIGYKWKEKDFFPFMDAITDAFGMDRIMFGSDWPVCLLAGSYNEVIGIMESYFKSSSNLDIDKVMGVNASKFYNIKI